MSAKRIVEVADSDTLAIACARYLLEHTRSVAIGAASTELRDAFKDLLDALGVETDGVELIPEGPEGMPS